MKNRRFFYILSLLVFCAFPCWAGDSHPSHSQDMAIHTWGGGELLQRVFQSISMVIYGNSTSGIDQTFNGILRIGMTIGGFCCICLAFLREKFEPLIKNFFLPCIFIMCCLLVPRTTIYIQDHLAQKASSVKAIPFIKVEKVPYFLGKFASLVSTISYTLTDSLEHVAHGVNDKLYDWTGHIYAAENIFLTKKCRIANPVVEDNFRDFCRECVFRDLGLGIYSKEALVNSKNVVKFLQENTSRIRTIFYRDSSDNGQNGSSQGNFITCRDAINKMATLFGKEKGNTKQILIGEVGNDFQFLLKEKASGESSIHNLITQQIAINILKEEIPGTLTSFSSKRAELLQKENQKVLGALGANSIVAMRNFFEATIYMVFPLVIVVSLLSFGLKPLMNWIHFILWVNTWPIFYVVVKFLLSSMWEFRTKRMFGDTYDLTIFTSEGLSDLYSSMESIAAIAMAFIPFLSWILLKGGVGQMVQLASSLMAPAQSAASTVSAEKTYGNYSFGNMNLDNVNGHNASTFRQTYSGFLSSGSASVDTGTETMTYTPRTDGLYVKQADSHLREGISKTQAFSHAVQESFSTSQTALSETSKSFSENLADTSNKTVGFVEALSKQFQNGENYNTQKMTGLQESVQFIKGVGDDYAKSKGISSDTGMREVISSGIGFSFGLKANIDGSYQDGVSKSESDSQLDKVSNSESFQKHLQNITNASSGEVGSILKGEDARLHDDLSHSFSNTQAASSQLRAAYAENEALSNLQSASTSDNVTFHQNLNQRFVEFLGDKYHDIGKINEVLEMPNESLEKSAIIKEFTSDLLPKRSVGVTKEDMENKYGSYQEKVENLHPESFENKKGAFIEEHEKKIGHRYGDPIQLVEKLKAGVKDQGENQVETIEADKERIDKGYNTGKQHTKDSTTHSTAAHFFKKATSINTPTSIYDKLFGADEKLSTGEK